jgi:sugar lactone lactonase YvrE
VYVVGADTRDGRGPWALHYDGRSWQRLSTGLASGDLWWVYGPTPDVVFMVGSGGTILRHTPRTGNFEAMSTPGAETLFGVWGAAANDVWAVGGNISGTGRTSAVLWHFNGTAWENRPLPMGFPEQLALFKVWGSAANDVWAVGENGVTIHYDGSAWSLAPVPDTARGRLFTVAGRGAERYAVGGFASGVILEGTGTTGWRQPTLDAVARLNGVFVPATGSPLAVGANGTVLQRRAGTWREIARPPRTLLDFHSVWVDPTGQVWAVGGQINATPMTDGMLWHFGSRLPELPIQGMTDNRPCPEQTGVICTYAGSGIGGYNGDGMPLRQSHLYWPIDMAFGPTGTAVILDWNNHSVRRVTAEGTFETIMGGISPGDGPPDLSDLQEPGAPGPMVALNHPTDLFFEADGRLLVVAWHNHKLRRWDPATGRVFVTLGRGAGFQGDNGPTAMALLKQPSHAERDAQGNLYILDQGNLRLRRVDALGNITTVAGDGMRGFAGDGGPALMARFNLQIGENPEPEGGLAIAPDGRVFITDTGNHRIRVFDPRAGTMDTFAGTGMYGFGGDDGPARLATFNSPQDIEFGPDGRLYVADTNNHRIRAIDLTTGVISTVVGNGQRGFSGDYGPAREARLWRPYGVAFDARGNLYVSDSFNQRIRRVWR